MTIAVISTTLYLDGSLESQRLEILAAEKGDHIDIVRSGALPNELRSIHPSGTLPLLLDKHLILHGSALLDSYFEERFPAPPLLPTTPIARSKVRFLAEQIKGWYELATTDLKALHERIDEFGEALDPRTHWFAGEMFTMIDVAIAPILINAGSFAYPLPPTSPLGRYATRLQARSSVVHSAASIAVSWTYSNAVGIELYH